jgi:hypothetical protein
MSRFQPRKNGVPQHEASRDRGHADTGARQQPQCGERLARCAKAARIFHQTAAETNSK